MSLTQLYIFTVILPNIASTAAFIGGCLVVVAIITAIAGAVQFDLEDESSKKCFSICKKSALWLVVVCLVTLPIPSERQMYILAGGYVATNAKDVKKLPDNVVKAANAWLEKAAALAEPEKKTR